MKLLATKDGQEVWLHELTKPYHLPTPFAGEHYVCILFANDESITIKEQAAVSDQLIGTGCNYAICAGHKCASWDDSVDWAYLATVDYKPDDETLVMTTWHENDSVEEVLHFGLISINLTAEVCPPTLILLVGAKDGLREEIQQAIHSVWDL